MDASKEYIHFEVDHVEVYKRETREIIRRFMSHQINHAECIAGLDAAVAALVPALTSGQIMPLRAHMQESYRIVEEEAARRREHASDCDGSAEVSSE
jgi:hypothetical protein